MITQTVYVPPGGREGGGGVLPYMGYIGMCRCEGYDFKQFALG